MRLSTFIQQPGWKPVANHPNLVEVTHPTDCKPKFSPRVFCGVAVAQIRWLIHLGAALLLEKMLTHDDVIKWKHFSRYWPFVPGIHRSPANSPHKGQWRGALMFPLKCVGINGWINNREAVDLKRYCAHYDVSVMCPGTVRQWKSVAEGYHTRRSPRKSYWLQPNPLGGHIVSLGVNRFSRSTL